MSDTAYILAHDVGTTGNKSCIYRITDKIELVDSYLAEYPVYTLSNGGVEQKADEWWNALCTATKAILTRSKIAKKDIMGMTFCAQMQGSIMVDENGDALRNPMSYMDGRSTEQIARYLYRGLFKIGGKFHIPSTLKSLYYTGGMAATAKDPLWKYHWVRDNEPEIFKKTHKWLDVKDYLTLRCTGNYGMTRDSANATFVYDTRPGKLGWSKSLCRLFDVDMNHLPPVLDSTDIVGNLSARAAGEMGLAEGTPVFGGGGDVSLISIGSGCLDLHDTHIYIGTSGWVVANVDRRMVDIDNFVASILGAIPGRYNYVAEQETSGACLQWVRDHLALDEIGMYLEAKHVCEMNDVYESLYDFLNQVISQTPAGSGGVIFTPWLHGNRAPKEDPYARGMFFNLSLTTGKRQMIRSVVEGMAFHKRWMLEAIEKRIPHRETLRFVGGGAKSPIGCQIMADITGRRIETIRNTQNAGTIGATITCAVGLGLFKDFSDAKSFIPVDKIYEPNKANKARYDKNFNVFKELYGKNKKLFEQLNAC
ncbi:MAG TPA: FGGY-family carbohydrate kinase [Spirochaetota bacterium]|nr:FGGY-family carbohydrate kinase [Spirochaetota bacterium]HSA15751.1 FGGY-family carbohydrate kinase [Spirochaetota bacterium]